MKNKVLISADSTCDIGDELKNMHEISFYPFHVILDGVDYQDNVTIKPDEIFETYWKRKILPKTSAINVAEYVEYFRPMVEAGYEVIHLNLGGALSSAHQNCLLAAKELGNIYPIDSYNLSTGIGHLVLQACDMVKKGYFASDIVAELEQMRGNVHSSFILDTLEFMRAGGRCSSVVAIGASLLNLKPCIEVDNTSGAMSVGKKYRGNLDKVLVKYTKDKLAEYDQIDTKRIFITHSGIDKNYIDLVKETICETIQFDEIYTTRASCTISSHCGPNTLGILFMTK